MEQLHLASGRVTTSLSQAVQTSASHALSHTWFIFFILFFIYFLVMKLERSLPNETIKKSRVNSPFSGGLLGLIPQCGVAVVASDLFNRRKITLGTLLAVLISSSDEALVILFSAGVKTQEACFLLAIKCLLAIFVGFIIDKIYHSKLSLTPGDPLSYHCACCPVTDSIWRDALRHGVKVSFFVFFTFLFFELSLTLLGKGEVYGLMLTDSPLQPLIVAAVGLIPVCAVSIILASLYLSGSLSFGSTLAGLISAGGFGLVVLVRGNENPKLVVTVLLLLYGVAASAGLLFDSILG